ncbi:hypothetical protein BGZ95_000176 [Linnemannia exigua]|uniref:Uncharacterized protein n=1 Tax=Linnemannia exigua TaxID=604196 RepID=A0AAD4H4J1_9FUNG|nr:hypothetical protein BGZ95_000176 [Linnemannia exigua]
MEKTGGGQGAALFAFGSNGNGQLGIASDDDTSTPQHVHFTTTTNLGAVSSNLPPSPHHNDKESRHQPHVNATAPFHDFAAGGNHTALITHGSRRLYMTGSNKDGETLLQEQSQVFKLLNGIPDGVQQQQEKLNKNQEQGQDGSGSPIDKDADKDKADTNSTGIRWRSVACGWAFTIGLTEPYLTPDSHDAIASSTRKGNNQAIYAWGSGSFGELGLGPGRSKTGGQAIAITTGLLDSSNTTVRDNSRFEIIKVRAGLRHVLLLAKEIRNVGDQNGDGGATKTRMVLMGWGSNRQGQLGVLTRLGLPLTEKELRGKFMEPTRIVISPGPLKNTTGAEETHDDGGNEPNIVDMACGQNHSLVLFSNGTVHSSGLDKYGQLGPRTAAVTTEEKETAEKGKKVDFRIGFAPVVGLPFVDSISCGWNHNAAMDTRPFVDPTAMTTIYLWGRNDHGQLGGGVPLRTLDVNLTGALGGAFEGIVQVQIPTRRKANSGDDEGRSECKEESEKEYEPLVSYSCGSEHTLAMTQSGACYAWGWNEHGNCGGGIDSTGNKDLQDVPSPRLVQFPTPSNSPGQGWVMGGYGSSWVWT